MSPVQILVPVAILTALLSCILISALYWHRLSFIPGPVTYSLSQWRLALDEWNGKRTRRIDELHKQYGLVIRIGPNEVHFNSSTALRTIYGPGSGFERTDFYRLFEAYGTMNMFSFRSSRQHAQRRKMLARIYSKSSVLATPSAKIVEEKVGEYLKYLNKVSTRNTEGIELFSSLHYYALDSVSRVLFGSQWGATSCMTGTLSHQHLLDDVFEPSRRQLIWFSVHFPKLVDWMYTRQGVVGRLVRPVLPMKPPITYSGVRGHALAAWKSFHAEAKDDSLGATNMTSVISLLFNHHISQEGGHLDGLDIASECADHLLAGVDTTANTLMFLIWALSLPENHKFQQTLIEEIHSNIPDSSFAPDGVPSVGVVDKLTYLNAVVKEALRLYAPLPATQPRSCLFDTVVDGYKIPAGTVVGMSAYSLHRNENIFASPLTFDPSRWLEQSPASSELNRWFWAFSSGGRQCLGNNLAMAEMTTLIAPIYRHYTTCTKPGFEHLSPVVTSRFECIYDEGRQHMKVSWSFVSG